MSPIAIGMDALLALLLTLALALGLKLNARLKTLRDSQAGFAAAAIELNEAAARAEAGLQALRAASESAHDDLLARIETARGLVGRLERAGAQAQHLADAAPEPLAPSRPAGGTLAAIAALAEGRSSPRAPASALAAAEARGSAPAASPRAPPPPRRAARASLDDDLFETKARERADLGPLRAPRGER